MPSRIGLGCGDEKATASCRAVRAEQAGNGDSYSVAVFVCSETPARIVLRFVSFPDVVKGKSLIETRRLEGYP